MNFVKLTTGRIPLIYYNLVIVVNSALVSHEIGAIAAIAILSTRLNEKY